MLEAENAGLHFSQDSGDGLSPGIPNGEPNHLRGRTFEQTPLTKILVLGNDRISMLAGIVPDNYIVGVVEAASQKVGTIGVVLGSRWTSFQLKFWSKSSFTRRSG